MTTHHTLPADQTPAEAPSERTVRGGIFSNEDWWAVWIGLAVIVVAWGLFAGGHSIKWLAVAPAKWTSLGQAGADFTKHASNYVALFVVLAAPEGLLPFVVAQLRRLRGLAMSIAGGRP